MAARRVRVDRRPLLDIAADVDLFVGRQDELDRLHRSIDLGLNAAVVGEPGTGKSSLLRRLAFSERRDRPERPEPVQVSASNMPDVATLLRELLRRVAGDEAAAAAELANSVPAALLERLRVVLPERSLVLVDDLAADRGRELFGSLRDEVWRLGLSWVVAIDTAEAAALLRPPADVFFETVVRLAPLAVPEAHDLLRRRGVDLGDSDADTLAQLAGGVPRRLVDLARAVVADGRPVSGLVAERTDQARRLDALGEPARALVEALADVGPAGPSDPELQRRMGVTRPRLVTLFRQLEDAGVVVELLPDRSAGTPGRPRTRYALTEHSTDTSAAAETVGGSRDSPS
jgi:hypothetical protein